MNLKNRQYSASAGKFSGYLTYSNRKSMTRLDLWCFFICGVASSLGFTCIQSSLVYISSLYGDKFFIDINLAIYGTALPMCILQSLLDRVSGSYASSRMVRLRMLISYAGMAIMIVIFPYVVHSAFLLLLTTGIIGIFSGESYGLLYHIISRQGDPCVIAICAMGYQASGVVVFLLSIASGFFTQTSYTSMTTLSFFGISSSLVILLGCGAFLVIDENWNVDSPEPAYVSCVEDDKDGKDVYFPLFPIDVWCCVVSMFVTVSSSILLLLFYPFVRSATDTDFLPEYLYYTKLFSDMLARLMTIVWNPITHPKWLIFLSSIRLLFVPIFFLYLKGYIQLVSDFSACCFIALFSFSSGFLHTVSYQILAALPGGSVQDKREATHKMNIGFKASLLFALLSGVAVQACFFEPE